MDDVIGAAALGDLLNLNASNIRRWTREGVLVRAEAKGTYRLYDSVKAYTRHLQKMAGGRAGFDPSIDLIGASAALKHEQAELAKTRRLILSGTVIEVTRILPVWQRFARTIRQALLAVPSRCRSRAPHWSAFDAGIVDEEIRSVLTQIGTHPPVMDDGDIDAPDETVFKPRRAVKVS